MNLSHLGYWMNILRERSGVKMKDVNEAMKQLQEAANMLGEMKVDRANPWDALSQMQSLFNQDFWNQLGTLTNHTQNYNHKATQTKNESDSMGTVPNGIPKADIFQTAGKIIVCCDIAGLDRNSLKVSVDNENQLTVQGKIKQDDLVEYCVSKERLLGRFMRQIQLPSRVSAETMQTNYRDGLLEIQLMKKRQKRE
jgi:HSP20 family protein